MNFDEALKMALERMGPDSTESDAELLVIGAYRSSTGRNRTFSKTDLYMRAIHPFPHEAEQILRVYLEKRREGIPVAYILGYQYFLHHEYLVRSGVLIPRQETELLVFQVFQYFKRRTAEPKLGFELGLGSGCISIELLKSFSDLKMVATELSPVAREVTSQNASRILGVDFEQRLAVISSEPMEVYENLASSTAIGKIRETGFPDRKFDFIVSNPPYLASSDEAMDAVVKFEPPEALFAPEEDILYFYRKLLDKAPLYLEPNGVLFLEIPHERAEEIKALAQKKTESRGGVVEVVLDLTGRPRVLQISFDRTDLKNESWVH